MGDMGKASIDAADTAIRNEVQFLEDELHRSAIGVRLRMDIKVAEFAGELAWEKVNTTWRFVLDGRPLTDANRDVRAAVALLLPQFIARIPDMLAVRVAERAESLKAVRAAIEAVRAERD